MRPPARRLALACALALLLALAGAVQAAPLQLAAPAQGDLLTRVQALWATSLPIIQTDQAAGLSDAEYLERRKVIFTAWVRLQAARPEESGVAPATREAIGRLIPRILELVDQVYGFPGYKPEKRARERANTGRARYLIKDIEKKLGAIK